MPTGCADTNSMNASASLTGSTARTAAGDASPPTSAPPPARRAWRRRRGSRRRFGRCLGRGGLRLVVGVDAFWRRRGAGDRLGGRCAVGRGGRRARRRLGGVASAVAALAGGFAASTVVGGLGAFLASLTERRLAGPRTGDRSMKTQPTCGTGLPPIRRPSSNSHAYWPWNSWKESFESTTASARSAICKHERVAATDRARRRRDQLTGDDRLFERRRARSRSMRFGKVASTTTVTVLGLYSSRNARTASSSCARLGKRATFGRDVRSVDDDVLDGHPVSKSTSSRALHRGMLQQIASLEQPLHAHRGRTRARGEASRVVSTDDERARSPISCNTSSATRA